MVIHYTPDRMDVAARFFIRRNAFLTARKILDALETAPEGQLPEPLLTQAWECLTDLAGYARPAERWKEGR